MTTLNELRDEALRVAIEHGFTEATVLEDMALIVTEVAEAIEDYRACKSPTDVWYEHRPHGDKPCGIPSEMADVVIRVLHFCGKHGIDIERAVAEKMSFNNSRPFRHGKTI
jgi:NTP pyrophosphatase (non-canonical NTP hydrolase)